MNIKEYIKTIEDLIHDIEELKKTNRDSYKFSRWIAVIQNLFEQFPLIHKKLEDDFNTITFSPGAYFIDDPKISEIIQEAFIDGLQNAEKTLRMIKKEVDNYGMKAFKHPEKFQNDINIINGQSRKIKKYDAFLAHANEDKETIANKLFKALTKKGLMIWYDDFCIKPGDSIREKIDEGIKNSSHGLLLLSKNFFKKTWCVKELNGLFSKNISNIKNKVIPIWYRINRTDVEDYSHIIADISAIIIKNEDINKGVKDIFQILKESSDNKGSTLDNKSASNLDKSFNNFNISIKKQETFFNREKQVSCDSIGVTLSIVEKPDFYLDIYITKTQAAVYNGHTNKDPFEYLIEKGRNILNNKITRNNYKSQTIDLSDIIRKMFNS